MFEDYNRGRMSAGKIAAFAVLGVIGFVVLRNVAKTITGGKGATIKWDGADDPDAGGTLYTRTPFDGELEDGAVEGLVNDSDIS